MAVTVLSSGTVTVSSSGTEQILYTTTSAGVFVLGFDTNALVAGDTVILRAKATILSSTDLTKLLYEAAFSHAQTERLKASVPVVGPYGVSFTVAGSTDSASHSYDWHVASVS